MKYESKRNGIKVELVDQEDDSVVVEYLEGPKVGETARLTNSTFKRWWKKVEDEAEETENNGDAEVEGAEETLVPMPGIDGLEELKKEYDLYDSGKIDYNLLKSILENSVNFENSSLFYNESKNQVVIKLNNKRVIEFYAKPRKNSVLIAGSIKMIDFYKLSESFSWEIHPTYKTVLVPVNNLNNAVETIVSALS